MATQQTISAARLAKKVGSTLEVLIDEIDGDGAIGRSWADAPDIDGNVFVNDATNLNVGDRVQVKIEQADDYDLWGSAVSAGK